MIMNNIRFINDGIKELSKINFLTPIVFTSERYFSRVQRSLKSNKNIVDFQLILIESKKEPYLKNILNISKQIKINADCVIAVGGGSIIDYAKASYYLNGITPTINELIVNQNKQIINSGNKLPYFISICCVTGSGAEISSSSIININNIKSYLISNSFVSNEIIYSIRDINSLPLNLRKSGLSDSLLHIIESLFSKLQKPDFIFKMKIVILEMIKEKYINNIELTAEDLCLISYIGGISQDKHLVGPVHSISHNSMFKLKHSVLVCSLFKVVYNDEVSNFLSNEVSELFNWYYLNWNILFNEIIVKIKIDKINIEESMKDISGRYSSVSKELLKTLKNDL